MEEAPKAKRESDRSRGKTRVNRRMESTWVLCQSLFPWWCVFPLTTETLQNQHSFYKTCLLINSTGCSALFTELRSGFLDHTGILTVVILLWTVARLLKLSLRQRRQQFYHRETPGGATLKSFCFKVETEVISSAPGDAERYNHLQQPPTTQHTQQLCPDFIKDQHLLVK